MKRTIRILAICLCLVFLFVTQVSASSSQIEVKYSLGSSSSAKTNSLPTLKDDDITFGVKNHNGEMVLLQLWYSPYSNGLKGYVYSSAYVGGTFTPNSYTITSTRSGYFWCKVVQVKSSWKSKGTCFLKVRSD